MISQDDIDAFADERGPDIKAAAEFVRRAEKGLPPDRWSDGEIGAQSVAKGIRALFEMNQMVSGAFLTIWEEKMQAAQDATRLHRADSKYARAEAGQ